MTTERTIPVTLKNYPADGETRLAKVLYVVYGESPRTVEVTQVTLNQTQETLLVSDLLHKWPRVYDQVWDACYRDNIGYVIDAEESRTGGMNDLPRFRLVHPEEGVGYLVPDPEGRFVEWSDLVRILGPGKKDLGVLSEQAGAWNKVAKAIDTVLPRWYTLASTGADAAVAAVHCLGQLAGTQPPVPKRLPSGTRVFIKKTGQPYSGRYAKVAYHCPDDQVWVNIEFPAVERLFNLINLSELLIVTESCDCAQEECAHRRDPAKNPHPYVKEDRCITNPEGECINPNCPIHSAHYMGDCKV